MKLKLLPFTAGTIAIVAISIYYMGIPRQKINLEQQSTHNPSKEIEQIDFVEDVNLVIDGILYSEDKPATIIKGAIIHEGDTVQGKKILRIYKNGIELEQFGKIWQQQVNEPVKIAAKQEYYIPSSSTYENMPPENTKQKNLENDYGETTESAHLGAMYKNRNCSPSLNREQNKRYVRSSYNDSATKPLTQENLFGDSTRIGNNRFYSVSYSNGDYLNGTTTNVGQFGFHHFNRSDGTSISGTTTNIGNYGFHQFSLSDGTNIYGTSTKIGNYDFHNFTTSDGRSVNGTSTHIGNVTFNNYNDSAGNSINGTTTNIGNMSFSNYDH
jgi:hypothetical protein